MFIFLIRTILRTVSKSSIHQHFINKHLRNSTMWFRQAQLFQLKNITNYSPSELCQKLSELEFTECLPSIAFGAGWVSPVDEEGAALAQALNGYIMICLKIEEKILPSVVIRQEVENKIKEIEMLENRKVGQKEKYSIKEEMTITLLPRAFSKFTKVYAYIDTKNHWVIVGTTNTKKTQLFLSAFRKMMGDNIHSFQAKPLSDYMTSWLKDRSYPSSFSIEKSCVLQDSNHESRVIRCNNQDLFANSIQLLIKDGCKVKQLAMNWQDRINFVLLEDFTIQSIKFTDEIKAEINQMEAGTALQQFAADFLIMTESFGGLFKDLLYLTNDQSTTVNDNVIAIA